MFGKSVSLQLTNSRNRRDLALGGARKEGFFKQAFTPYAILK
jgi:hypothetical protein